MIIGSRIDQHSASLWKVRRVQVDREGEPRRAGGVRGQASGRAHEGSARGVPAPGRRAGVGAQRPGREEAPDLGRGHENQGAWTKDFSFIAEQMDRKRESYMI